MLLEFEDLMFENSKIECLSLKIIPYNEIFDIKINFNMGKKRKQICKLINKQKCAILLTKIAHLLPYNKEGYMYNLNIQKARSAIRNDSIL